MSTLRIDGSRAGRVAVVAALAAGAAIGVGGERWASAGDGDAVPLVESAPSVIVPLAPARILDTRTGVGAPAGRVAPGSTLTLQVSGMADVPAEATGVVLNLTATVADGSGYVTAHPAGQERPNSSVINYSAGEDVANMITAQLGAGGALAIFNDQANVHLLADVAGYLVPGTGSGGLPGPVGPEGPPGPQGPQGPAGPGATLIRQEFATSVDTVLTTIGGVELVGRCAGPNGLAELTVRTPNASLLSVQGVWNWAASSETVALRNVQSESQQQLNAVWFSGLLSRSSTGATYQVEIGIRSQNPCQAWGSIIPVA